MCPERLNFFVMPTRSLFLKARSLSDVVEHLAELPAWAWLYISGAEPKVTLKTGCLQTAVGSRDMSEVESSAARAGLKCFLSRDQLEDIIENLRQQTPEFTLDQLAAAIDHYWRHDAFIDLSKPLA